VVVVVRDCACARPATQIFRRGREGSRLSTFPRTHSRHHSTVTPPLPQDMRGKSRSRSSSNRGGRRSVNSDGGGGTGVRRELEEDDGNWVIGSGSRKRLLQWRCTFVDGVGVRGGRGTTMVASASASSVAAAAAAAVALAVITAAADRLRCARLPAAGNKCPVKSDPESRYDNNSIL